VAVLDVIWRVERVYPVADILATAECSLSCTAMACCPGVANRPRLLQAGSRWQTLLDTLSDIVKLRLQVIRPAARVGVWRG